MDVGFPISVASGKRRGNTGRREWFNIMRYEQMPCSKHELFKQIVFRRKMDELASAGNKAFSDEIKRLKDNPIIQDNFLKKLDSLDRLRISHALGIPTKISSTYQMTKIIRSVTNGDIYSAYWGFPKEMLAAMDGFHRRKCDLSDGYEPQIAGPREVGKFYKEEMSYGVSPPMIAVDLRADKKELVKAFTGWLNNEYDKIRKNMRKEEGLALTEDCAGMKRGSSLNTINSLFSTEVPDLPIVIGGSLPPRVKDYWGTGLVDDLVCFDKWFSWAILPYIDLCLWKKHFNRDFSDKTIVDSYSNNQERLKRKVCAEDVIKDKTKWIASFLMNQERAIEILHFAANAC